MNKKSKAMKHSKSTKHLQKGKHEEAVKPLTTVQLSAPYHVDTQLNPGTTPAGGTVTSGWDLVTNKTNA